MTVPDLIRAAQVQPARPWPRHGLGSQAWRELVRALERDPVPQFEALWADAAQVYALFTRPEPLLVSAPVEAGVYAALSPARPAASWFERAIGDLWGHLAAHALDPRPLLDHGGWTVLRPMLARPVPNAGSAEPVQTRPAPKGWASVQYGPVGPCGPIVTALAARGERLVEAEIRPGYGHRGVLDRMRGKNAADAAPLVARLSAAGTIAHSVAFARAVEAAAGAEPPPRAAALRSVAGAAEQVAIGLHHLARTFEAAGHDPAAFEEQRETVLRASALAFGHRLLMDVVVPGGVARDITPEGPATLAEAVTTLRAPSLAALARRPGLRAVEARLQALLGATATVESRLASLPEGPLRSAVVPADGEGLGRADGPGGVYWHWVQFREGRIAEAFARDPAWLLWPALEQAAVGARLGEFPLLLAASGASVAGVDL